MRALLALLLLAPLAVLNAADATAKKPNVIVILTDDLGYDDVGCYWTPDKRPGFEKILTPNIDRLAAEGARFTDYYAPSSVCSPSRAALMTGCYPVRVGFPGILFPSSPTGLNPDEVTLAEILKKRGYATACVGKWHLGHLAPFTPRQHGFDSFYGMMFPNDMQPFVLQRDETVVEPKPDQKTLNERFTEEAVKFVRAKREEPFFLYLSYSAPHIPLHVPDRLRGKSARGLYGDVVEHLDSGVGEVLKALDETGLADQTLIVFTSDNGPDTRGPYDKRGQAFPLRAAKATTREGGVRVPCIMRWPGRRPRLPRDRLRDGRPAHRGQYRRSAASAGPDHRWKGHSPADDQARCAESSRRVLLLQRGETRGGPQRELEARLPAHGNGRHPV